MLMGKRIPSMVVVPTTYRVILGTRDLYTRHFYIIHNQARASFHPSPPALYMIVIQEIMARRGVVEHTQLLEMLNRENRVQTDKVMWLEKPRFFWQQITPRSLLT